MENFVSICILCFGWVYAHTHLCAISCSNFCLSTRALIECLNVCADMLVYVLKCPLATLWMFFSNYRHIA